MSLEEGKVFAGHRIDGVVGKGGMGVVYRATHVALDLTVALKVMAPELAEDDEFRQRFRRESRLAASLDDAHIVPVRHAGEEEGLLYVTMRLVNGPDLGQLLEAEGPLEPARAVEIVEQIGAALDAAHEKGLIHRDVKPANILVEQQPGGPCAYLTDFGLTRRSVGSSGLTRTGHWVGTLDYVAPEQIRSEKLAEGADLYSLGCVLFQALTGHAPFEQESDVATMYAHLEQPLPPLAELAPGLPPELDEVLARATAKDPAERFGSCAEFAAAAREVVKATGAEEAEGATKPPVPLPPPAGETQAAAPPPAGETKAGSAPAAGETKAAPTPPADETKVAAAPDAGETRAAATPAAGETRAAAAPADETKAAGAPPAKPPKKGAAEKGKGKPPEKGAAPKRAGKPAAPSPAAARRRRWIAAAALAGAALVAVVLIFGVGGGDDSGTSGEVASSGREPPPNNGGETGGGDPGGGGTPTDDGDNGKFIPTAEGTFRQRADDICTQLESEVEFATSTLEESFGYPYDDSGRLVLTVEQRAQVLAERARIINAGIRRLRALQAPAGMEADFDRYLDYRQGFANGLLGLRNALLSGDPAAIEQASSRVQDLLAKKRQSAARLNFVACGDQLTTGDEEEISRLVTDFVTGQRPDTVCTQLTEAMLQNAFGGVGGCVDALTSAPISSSAEIVDLYGVDGVHAFVTVATDEGDLPALVDFEEFEWRLDAIVATR